MDDDFDTKNANFKIGSRTKHFEGMVMSTLIQLNVEILTIYYFLT